MSVRRVRKAERPPDEAFQAVPSKSATHRALVAASLARGPSTIVDPLDADDTRATRDALVGLGIRTRVLPGRWIVDGVGGAVPGGGELFLHESGTSLRFLLALAALGAAPSTLDGSPRLRERPIRELASALVALGGSVESTTTSGGLPLRAGGTELVGGHVSLPSGRSSQFASALLLLGAWLPRGIELTLEPPVVSLPYVELTADVLAGFGVAVERPEALCWRVRPRPYTGRELTIEGDHSSASYFLIAAAVLGGRVRVRGLSPHSKQPDRRLGEILEKLDCRVTAGDAWVEVQGSGSLPGFDVELTDAPDLAPALAVVGLFADGPCMLRGVAHLRHKESDRLEVLARNLRALGREAEAGEDRLEIGPAPAGLRGTRITTDSDHRIAMAFAVAGLRLEGVTLDDAECVSKSNPAFWREFSRLEGR